MELFNLETELAQSKIIIDLNEINAPNNTNKFLSSRKWECLDDNKIEDLNKRVESIYDSLDKNKLNHLKSEIEKSSLENCYKNYNPFHNKYPIGFLSSLSYMVDYTFLGENVDIESRKNETNELTAYMYKFRSIKGDGDCFYRGLIFSILENIVFNNNIMEMKELLILYHEKININNQLINEKDYLQRIKTMNINIVSEILYILITQMENEIKKAYEILLKVFLFCPEFDFGIIYFTRYLIYEYISANEDKIYSKDNPLEVGCLLPDEYIIDKGEKNEYLFEDYYATHLMVPKTFAEKIVLYVVPFIFNISMNVLVYDYGNNGVKSQIQEKKFLNENDEKTYFQSQVNLLFRKLHYDIYYKYLYYEDYKTYLDILINEQEDLLLFQENNIQEFPEVFKISDSIDEIKPVDDDLNLPEKNLIEEDLNIVNNNNKNINDNFMSNINIDNNNDYNFNNNNKIVNHNNIDNYYIDNNIIINDNQNKIYNAQCPQCSERYNNEDNIFGICNKCLCKVLKSSLHSAFIEFLKEITNLVNSKEKFKDLLLQKKCTISNQDNISLYDAISMSKFNFNELFFSVRNNMCLFCGKLIDEGGEYCLELPCRCKICCIDHLLRFIQIIKKRMELLMNNPVYFKYINLLTCFCGFVYNTKNILYMIKELEKKELYEEKEIYQNYLSYFWNWRCFLCKNNFEIRKEFCKVSFECKNINKNLLIPNQEFKHLVCDECLCKHLVHNRTKIFCNICELEHELFLFFKVNESNEEGELINI